MLFLAVNKHDIPNSQLDRTLASTAASVDLVLAVRKLEGAGVRTAKQDQEDFFAKAAVWRITAYKLTSP